MSIQIQAFSFMFTKGIADFLAGALRAPAGGAPASSERQGVFFCSIWRGPGSGALKLRGSFAKGFFLLANGWYLPVMPRISQSTRNGGLMLDRVLAALVIELLQRHSSLSFSATLRAAKRK